MVASLIAPPFAVRLRVGRRVGHEVSVLGVGGELVVHAKQLVVTRRKEHAAAGFGREPLQRAFAAQRDSRNAADPDDIDRDACALRRGKRLVDARDAVLVVAVADQDDRAPVFARGQPLAELDQRVEDRRAARRSNRVDRFDDGLRDRRWAR